MSRDLRSTAALLRIATAVVPLLTIFGTSVLSAQAATGDRVRIRTTDREQVVGRLEQLGADSLILTDALGVRRSVARAGVTRFEVSRGRHRRMLAGAVIGTLAGALIGTGVGFALDAGEDAEYEDRCNAGESAYCGERWFDGIEVGIGAVLGSGIGLVTGVVAGSFPVERWRTVPLSDRVALLARPSRIGMSVRF